MAHSTVKVSVLLAVALLALPHADAGFGKGGLLLGKGKGGDVNVDVQCLKACSDVCIPVPNKVCQDVPYQTQVCQQIPVQQTKQVCNRVCTQTYSQPMGKGKGMVVPMGKGKGFGRHLLRKDGLILGDLLGKGKGKGSLVNNDCQDVCNDVPYTAYTTDCQLVTKTKTQCDIVYQQKCSQVCKPECQKITTVTTTQPVYTGKGKGVPIIMGQGKGTPIMVGKGTPVMMGKGTPIIMGKGY